MFLARPIAFVLGLLLLVSLPAVAQQPPSQQTPTPALFSHPVVSRDAERYESYLKGVFKPGKQNVGPTAKTDINCGFFCPGKHRQNGGIDLLPQPQ